MPSALVQHAQAATKHIATLPQIAAYEDIQSQIGLGEDNTPFNLKLMCTMVGRWLLKWCPLPIRAAAASLLVWQLTAPHPGLSVIATHLMQDYLPYETNLYAEKLWR